MILLWASPCEAQNSSNPRLQNFRYGTGQASWWKQPQQSPQVIIQRQYIPYYPYHYRPYYGSYCPPRYSIVYINGRPVIVRPQFNRLFFQFRF